MLSPPVSLASSLNRDRENTSVAEARLFMVAVSLISTLMALDALKLVMFVLMLPPLLRKKAARPASMADKERMTRPILMAIMFLCLLDFLAADCAADRDTAPAGSDSGSFSNPDRFPALPPGNKTQLGSTS